MSTRLTFGQLLWRVALVLVLAAIAGAAALVLSQRTEKSYTATSQLVYGVTLRPDLQALGAGTNDATQDVTRINTETAVLNSYDVAQRTARANAGLGMSANDIHDHVRATAVNESLVANLTATDTSAQKAMQLLRAYRAQYLKLRSDQTKQRAAQVENDLKAELASLPSSQRTGSRGAQLRQQLGALAALKRSGSGVPEVSQDAYAPSSAASPNTTRNVLFGILFGAALGIGLVALRPVRRAEADGHGDGGANGNGSAERHYDRPGAERELEDPVGVER
jgi:capsular polysaccharide biosynthesis protein